MEGFQGPSYLGGCTVNRVEDSKNFAGGGKEGGGCP